MKNILGKVKQALHNEFVEPWKWFFTKGNVTPPMLMIILLNIFFLLISNIIAVKTWVIYGWESGLQISIPAAVIVYALNLILSDLSAELEFRMTRFSCQAGFILNLLMVAIFTITINIPGVVGNNMEAAGGTMDTILGSTWFMFIASISSFYIGDLLNDLLFNRLKKKDGRSNSKFFKRCVLSTMLGQLFDATIFIVLGLQVLPGLVLGYTFTGGSSLADPMGWANTFIMIGAQWAVKVLVEIVISPLVIWLKNKIVKIDNISNN